VNGIAWRTDVPGVDYVPPAWQASVDEEQAVEVVVLLRNGPDPTVDASANGQVVIYRPSAEDPPSCN
jgi:hypothetical protein